VHGRRLRDGGHAPDGCDIAVPWWFRSLEQLVRVAVSSTVAKASRYHAAVLEESWARPYKSAMPRRNRRLGELEEARDGPGRGDVI
jgi:hypothetical protein